MSAHRRGAGAKTAFLNEYAQDLVVCLIVLGKLLLPQISIVRFVGLLFSLRCSAIFLVARATRNCHYSCPVQRYSLNKACTAAARSVCMHAHKCSSIERRPQSGFLTRSSIWICALRMPFLLLWSLITSYWAYFPLPQLAFDMTSMPTMPDNCRHRKSISLTTAPRNQAEHSFRKARLL